MIKNKVPTITRIPRKPVQAKKVLPYIESLIVKVASVYSINWKNEKIQPRKIVISNPWIVSFLSPETIARWAQVKETPELNKINVFNNGTDHGSKAIIPIEGKTHPISMLGDRLA